MTWAEREMNRLSDMNSCEWTEDDCETFAYIQNVNAESDWLDAQDVSDAEFDWQSWEDLREVR